MNRTGNNTTGWARRLTALLVTACLVMAMALPVYAEEDLLPDAPGEVELLEDEQGTASGEDTVPPEQNAATPVPDAATPEPEQSAEPEQPAPTETPEPTAEPTPTPEPAATATATPVPTVTPTATPEPTEQPQKMYAAKSVDNVQAVSEGDVPDTYTLYFAVPESWSDYTSVKICAVDTNNSNEQPYTLDMQEADKTKDGRKIYSAFLNKAKHYRFGGLNGLEFWGYKEDTLTDDNPTAKVIIADVNARTWWKTFDPTRENYIGGNYYDAEGAEGKKWSTYTVSHNHFAGKEMVFENKTSETLTNVQAWFYEPNENGELIQVAIALNNAGADSGIAPNSTATFTIPNDYCSYVQFTWNESGSTKSSKFYNFYGEKVSDDKKSFTYSDTSKCFIYTGEDNERWGIEKSVLIYYDATFSKLPTTGTNDTDGNYSIPKADQSTESTVYYCLKGKDKKSIGGEMSRIKGTDYYAADVPDGYTQIAFSSYPLSSDKILTNCGNNTDWVDIPLDYKDKEQCFYADTNDDTIYHSGPRGGYWAPKDTTPRDAEKGKSTGTKVVDVVDIASVPFTEEANTKYVTSTLYDYYTDYELNGKNRDTYDYDGKDGYKDLSHRNWVTFREFDQALSDYYKNAEAQYPIYTGHFQPEGGPEFSQIASTLNLFGYNNDNFNRFMAINNSQRNDNNTNGSKHIYYAYQGLVANTTNADGAPLLNGAKTETVEPHFNKDFLLGKNSKNAKLGEVYENVKFPFTKKVGLFTEDTGVDYWYFDSKDTTLYLKQDSGQNSDSKYFLQKSTEDKKGNSVNVDVTSTPQSQNGYFPFNETAISGKASTYNYGFGTKLQMDFTLTDDGKVETNKIVDGKKEKTSIKFFFSGDDDVWVFIDGQLALDVGGAHGKVSGLLEFGEKEEEGKKKNSVTAYVSKVKKGGTSDSDKDEKNGSAVKRVKYNNEDIDFYAQGTTLTFDKGQKHTLTMYYMERGMWESNMAVAFNFPDNNELQVQKEVELKNVDSAFKNCFKNQKIFNFTIQNQATHYGPKAAVGSDENENPSQKVDLTAEGNTIEPATPDKKDEYIFELVTNPVLNSGPTNEKVLHWYARYTDTEPVSKWRKNRYGILKLNEPINIKDMRFLTFQVYVDSEDGGELSLNNLYLELLDENDHQKGSLGTTGINGATYGSVELKTGEWVTVKLDLHKMKEQGGFNGNVKTIRVGDNYNRHIYFRNFTFIPKAVPKTMTGFTTDQKEIPDYHSVESGKLENAENAQYTSTMDTDTQLVDEDGRFVLEDGETVTFSDQFRRGSYISLKEDLNQNLYDTTWTVYENGQAVTSTSPTSTNYTSVTLGKSRSLDSQNDPAQGPDDGRTEVYVNEEGVKNDGYTESKKPSDNTIVFRSYKDPDEKSSTLTKLKVKYVNTVKTGGLKIQKQAAKGEENIIKGTYTFKVTFNDVGGEGLEEKDIIRYVEINMSDDSNPDHTVTITGIPVGTRYTIEEVAPEDGSSRLQSVTVPPNNKADVIKNTMVEGEIEESKNSDDLKVTAIFTNTKRKLINIEFNKLWEGTDNLSTANRPEKIYIQLQRRLASEKNWKPVRYPADSTQDYVTIIPKDYGWLYPFNNLDQYPINGSADNNYIYRIVEGTVDDKGNFIEVKPNETITIKGNTYVVTAEAKAEISEGDSTKVTNATVNGGTITGGSGKIELTNKLQNPKFALDIIKKDAENGENNKEVFLKDVEFKLEKLKAEPTTGGEPQVDTTYKFNSTNGTNIGSITAITKGDGKITGVFANLEPGTYRLTETKAHPGYNLLAQPIVIQFTQDGKCYIDGEEVKKEDKTFIQGANNTYTMNLTVLNRKTPELPHTGADAPSLWLLIGMPLAVAGLLIFTFRYNRKGGRRH